MGSEMCIRDRAFFERVATLLLLAGLVVEELSADWVMGYPMVMIK